jgi:RimJ/RimL family protein N-acetyltransferase
MAASRAHGSHGREDAAALAGLLAHESIGPRIYTMPNPINAETMKVFIEDHLDAARAGRRHSLFVSFNGAGEATAYFDVELWPQWSIAKFGGAVKAERQGRGFGGACGLAAVEWCFDQLGVARICETTARDNDRSIRLLSRLGFVQLGEVTASNQTGQRAHRSTGNSSAKPGKCCVRARRRVADGVPKVRRHPVAVNLNGIACRVF